MTVSTFDFSPLDSFDRQVIQMLLDEQPKEAKKLMQKAGNELRKELRRTTRTETKKKTGNLLRGIRRGRPYLYKSADGDAWQVRVYNKAPHAHLLEHGHELVAWGKEPKKTKYVAGRHLAGKANNAMIDKFAEFVDKFVTDLLNKGWS